MSYICSAFVHHGGFCKVEDISGKLEIPIRTTRRVLDELCSAGLVCQLQSDKSEVDRYQLAVPAEEITPYSVLYKLNHLGAMGYSTENSKQFEKMVDDLWKSIEQNPENKPLVSIKKLS